MKAVRGGTRRESGGRAAWVAGERRIEGKRPIEEQLRIVSAVLSRSKVAAHAE